MHVLNQTSNGDPMTIGQCSKKARGSDPKETLHEKVHEVLEASTPSNVKGVEDSTSSIQGMSDFLNTNNQFSLTNRH